MCGIMAVLLADQHSSCAVEICEGLGLLQHRGQDACGIVTCGQKGRFYQCKGNGMVRDVLDEGSVQNLVGSMGVGHVRYPTAGTSGQAEAQPFYVNSPYGIVFGHNGNLINTEHLGHYLDHYAHRHINTASDSELMLNMLADSLQRAGKFRIDEDDVFRAIGEVMKQCNGSYAVTAMIAGFGIIGFRDPNGIRPIGYAQRGDSSNPDWLIASESVVGDALGWSKWTDVKPGEAVIITKSNKIYTRQCIPARTFGPDIFEHVYFARPDSVLDGISVYRARMAMGVTLAAEVKKQLEAKKMTVDVVIPVPDTSRVAAVEAAKVLGLPYREGFVKNRYVGRTFIMPGQQMRRKNVRRKLNAMALEFQEKNVLLVDDSIVRGTTSKEIIQMAREAGAKSVVMASCAPPIRYPNVYGIDMPSRKELVAHGRTEEEVAQYIGANLIVYQPLESLVDSCQRFNREISEFDCSVFTGKYVTGGIDTEYLDSLEASRNDKAKKDNPSDAPNANANGSNELIGSSSPMNVTDSNSGREVNVGLPNSSLQHPIDRNDTIGLGNAR